MSGRRGRSSSFCSVVVRFLIAFLLLTSGRSFSPAALPSPSSKSYPICRNVVGPAAIDVGIAVVSAAAGVVSQLPTVSRLQKELEITRAALTDSEQEMVSRISEVEDRLHAMDAEFEAQTTKFQKQYDTRMREDLEKMTEKMKVDFQYNLEIRLEEQKSKMLCKQLDVVRTVTGSKNREELADLRLQRDRINKANAELEKALEASKYELEKLRHAAAKKGWWPL